MFGDDFGLGIPGVVDDDRPRLGVVVAPVVPADLHRKPVLAVIIFAGGVGAVRRRFGTRPVGEVVEIARVGRVGAAAMRDAEALGRAVEQVDDMEPRVARRLREIGNADPVAADYGEVDGAERARKTLGEAKGAGSCGRAAARAAG